MNFGHRDTIRGHALIAFASAPAFPDSPIRGARRICSLQFLSLRASQTTRQVIPAAGITSW
jgi:hypothetical protein